MTSRESETLGGRPENGANGRLSLYDRVVRARAIAVERVGPKPTPWPQIAKRHGIGQSTAKAIYAEYLSWDVEVADPFASVDEAIALHTGLLRQLTHEAEYADNSAARVGAAKAAIDVLRGRIELQQAMGRMPVSLKRLRAESDFGTITREVMEVMERRGVGEDVLAEIHETVRRHLPNQF